MPTLKNIIETSSAVGMLLGAAYYYLKQSKPLKVIADANPYNTHLSLTTNDKSVMTSSPILNSLSALNDLSAKICAEISLNFPMDSTITIPFLNKPIKISSNVQRTLNQLSVCTKNEAYLTKFIFYDGINLIKDVLSIDGINDFINEEIEQILSELFTNISLKPAAIQLNDCKVVDNLLSRWDDSDNIILNLNVIKFRYNISEYQKDESSQRTIFSPDIFLLDHPKFLSSNKEFDVIFINGMLGSVFFTWRQHDDEAISETKEKTKCWPRDWLSHSLPKSRVIGINALLRPFVWNPMSNIDKTNRSIELRAEELMNKLELANVGQRPILWVTHSAGGILLKHILRLSDDRPLARNTRSILFMSTPHSGAQSMLGLYYFPFKYFLTPEAKHLETNSTELLQLNSWFKEFAKEQNIAILTLTETEPTPINKFYSTVIVPKCDGEFDDDDHKELNVKSNHLYISKPRNQSDQIYISLMEFVNRTMMPPRNGQMGSGDSL